MIAGVKVRRAILGDRLGTLECDDSFVEDVVTSGDPH